MEKEPNNNSMNGTATMPSYFPCIKSSESHPLADWLYLKSVITSSPELRMMTKTYRKRLAISKQFADQYKPEMPAITVSALMDGYGRQLANFLKPTYMLQLDFSRDVECIWQCSNCGHIVVGKQAPEVCPVCNHPQSYFQIEAQNY